MKRGNRESDRNRQRGERVDVKKNKKTKELKVERETESEERKKKTLMYANPCLLWLFNQCEKGLELGIVKGFAIQAKHK